MPLFAAKGYFPGGAGQLPPRQGLVWAGASLGGPAALGAKGWLLVGGTCGRVVGEVLLQQPGGQLACQGTDAILALAEGDGGLVLVALEREVEGGLGLLQPLAAEMLALLGGVRDVLAHDGLRGKGPGIKRTPIILSQRSSCNNGNGPPDIEPIDR
jgi:hypothetical protein